MRGWVCGWWVSLVESLDCKRAAGLTNITHHGMPTKHLIRFLCAVLAVGPGRSSQVVSLAWDRLQLLVINLGHDLASGRVSLPHGAM